jgi:hypothetical protein
MVLEVGCKFGFPATQDLSGGPEENRFHHLLWYVRVCVHGMGFGLCNAPVTFSKATSLVLQGLPWSVALAFLNDASMLELDFEDHLINLRALFKCFRRFNLNFKPKMCALFQIQVDFFGRRVSQSGDEIGDEHFKVVRKWSMPTNTKEVERVLEFANYHRGLVVDYARIAVSLYQVTGKKTFVWELEQVKVFESLKGALISPLILALLVTE